MTMRDLFSYVELIVSVLLGIIMLLHYIEKRKHR